jgi:lambda repressor-like predicted transcriptional regulator
MSTDTYPIRRRKPNEAMIKRNRHICSLYKRGWTLGRIARRYGVSRERIQQIIAAAPVPKRRADGGEGERAQ